MQAKLSEYTDSEIRRIYRNQEDRNQGVQIIHELTGWTYQRIYDSLIEGGYTDVKMPSNKGAYLCGYRYETVYALYEQNYTDLQIAKYFKCTKGAVKGWRHRNGLISKHKEYNDTVDPIKFKILYLHGDSDNDIATSLNVHRTRVNKYRTELGLPANSNRGGYKRGLTENENTTI